jgi:(p)ppGpp synthase/HD superfamily hydrolase
MRAYAQTNVQLFNQLQSQGYTKQDRERVREAYEFAMHLFTGLFLPSGKTFIDHLVGTASILASLHVPVEVVTAGLIHAAYLHGDFGDGSNGISEAKRTEVRSAVGEAIEEYVDRYNRLLWSPEKILSLHKSPSSLSPVDRNALLMRLVNEFEHELDLGGLYVRHNREEQEWHQRYIENYGHLMAQLAERLGFPSLSTEMTSTFEKVISARVPMIPSTQSSRNATGLLVPKSYRVRLSPTRVHRSASTILARAKRLYRKALGLKRAARQIGSRMAHEFAGFYRMALRHIYRSYR